MPFDIQLNMGGKKDENVVRISVRIPEKMHELIEKLIGAGFYRDIADFMVRAIEDRLERHGFLKEKEEVEK